MGDTGVGRTTERDVDPATTRLLPQDVARRAGERVRSPLMPRIASCILLVASACHTGAATTVDESSTSTGSGTSGPQPESSTSPVDATTSGPTDPSTSDGSTSGGSTSGGSTSGGSTTDLSTSSLESDSSTSGPIDPSTSDGSTSGGAESTDSSTTESPGLSSSTGGESSSSTGDPSSSSGSVPECGDGVLDPGEACDDGAENGSGVDPCTVQCTLNICGDGYLYTPSEECDDGGTMGGDGCSPTCALEVCGNGVLDPGEACDDGGVLPGDGCSPTCALEECGNGVLDPGEVCDDGNAIEDDACTSLCQPPACGDGLLQGSMGEECDDGNTVGDDGCSATCTLEFCGDGIVEGAEVCDDGNAVQDDACTTLCLPPICGDGIVQASMGEECDDGNGNDFDACPNDCLAAVCGDGVVEGFEQCDDGGLNGDGTSACTAACTTNFCGDGYLFTPGEECDDGSATGNGQSPCSGACTVNFCGDGYVYEPVEECDDGGATATCTATCLTIASAIQVAAGQIYTCALLDTGGVRCFGSADNGQLGYASTVPVGISDTPADAGDVDVGGDVIAIDAGGATCALLSGGSVRCWGYGGNGTLGYGNTENIGDDETPASAGDVDVGGVVQQLSVGGAHVCALLQGGTVRCWGAGASGRLGYGNTLNIGDDETPSSAGDVNVGGTVIQLAAGSAHTCAVLVGGAVRCWGDGGSGQLGYGNTETIGDDETPASAGDVNVGGTVVELAANYHTCALLGNGAVRCWGPGSAGRLGYGNTNIIGDDETPASAGDVPLGGTAIDIAAGGDFTCAVLDTGAVRCWGSGLLGQLGYGTTQIIGDNELPSSAGDVPLGGLAAAVTADNLHTCALLVSGTVRCWGSGSTGQLGYGIGSVNIGDNEFPSSVGDVPLSP